MVIVADYDCSEAVSCVLQNEWLDYIATSSNVRLSSRQRKILDQLVDSHLARHLLRSRGPANNRQWEAYELETYGVQTMNPEAAYCRRQATCTARGRRLVLCAAANVRWFGYPGLQAFLTRNATTPRAPAPRTMSALSLQRHT
jgi:hypothetical protein